MSTQDEVRKLMDGTQVRYADDLAAGNVRPDAEYLQDELRDVWQALILLAGRVDNQSQ